ncbi:MAG: twin-arginine translocation signal domain-containing protein, partial [Proteobacteria bacterium]
MPSPVSRRSLLGGAAATVTLAACGKSKPKEGDVPVVPASKSTAEMPMRTLGKTGVKVSA